jgi:hypothetical protein
MRGNRLRTGNLISIGICWTSLVTEAGLSGLSVGICKTACMLYRAFAGI